MRSLGITVLIIVGCLLALLYTTAFIITEREQAVVLEFGAEVGDPKTEAGLYFKLPYQNVVRFEKRVLNLDPQAATFLLVDQRPLVVDYFLRYRIADPLKYLKALGSEQAAISRLQKTMDSQMRSALGKVSLEAILSEQRQGILREILKNVSNDTNRFGIDVVDVRIGKADLPPEISRNVYDRMIAERERLASLARAEGKEIELRERSKADLEVTQMVAEARRLAQEIRGRAEADAQRILNKAYGQDTDFFSFLRSMDAYKLTLAADNSYKILSTDTEFLKRLKSSQ